MEEVKLRNIPELFLFVAKAKIENWQYYDAAHMILLAVTDFDEHAESIDFLHRQMKILTRVENQKLLSELIKEIDWLNRKVIKKADQRIRLCRFTEKLAAFLRENRFELIVTEDNSKSADDLKPLVTLYQLAKEMSCDTSGAETIARCGFDLGIMNDEIARHQKPDKPYKAASLF